MPKTGNKPDIDADLVHKLARLLDEAGLTEIEYGTQDWHLRVAKAGFPSTGTIVSGPVESSSRAKPSEATEETTQPDDVTGHPGLITSPMVGVVYTLPEPETPVFVNEGDRVAPGDTLLLIEAMKVFNPIKAPRAGTVTRILVTNGAPVEYGEPLLIIE